MINLNSYHGKKFHGKRYDKYPLLVVNNYNNNNNIFFYRNVPMQVGGWGRSVEGRVSSQITSSNCLKLRKR